MKLKPNTSMTCVRGGVSPRALLGVAVFTLGAPSLAAAQADTYFDRTNNTSVLERPRPEYAPLGIHVGAFTVSPKLTIAPEYDDNIYATQSGQTGDVVTVIEPEVSAQSNWSRNEIDAFARVISNVFVNQGTQTTTDYQLGGNGRLDVYSNATVSGGLTYGHNTEPRTAENTAFNARSPVQYDTIGATLNSTQTLNRLRFNEAFSYTRATYQDTVDFSGNPLPQGYRDEDQYSLLGRADYALTPDLAIYTTLQVNNRVFAEKPPQVPLDRDSSGYQVAIGTTFDLTRLIRGHVEIGYLEQDYTSHLFKAVTGPAVNASVEYFVTPLTTITGSINRQVVDAADPVASSLLSTITSIQVDHELLRNVILSGRAGYENASYSGIQRTDDRETVSVSATYLLNRRVGITAMYSFLNENSSGVARIPNYVVNVAGLSIVFQI